MQHYPSADMNREIPLLLLFQKIKGVFLVLNTLGFHVIGSWAITSPWSSELTIAVQTKQSIV